MTVDDGCSWAAWHLWGLLDVGHEFFRRVVDNQQVDDGEKHKKHVQLNYDAVHRVGAEKFLKYNHCQFWEKKNWIKLWVIKSFGLFRNCFIRVRKL